MAQYVYNLENKYSEFTYWFVRKDADIFDVFQTSDEECVAELYHSFAADVVTFKSQGSVEADNAIKSDFRMFMNRPEYRVGSQDKTFYEFKTQEEGIFKYNSLLTGCSLIRARRNSMKDPDQAISKVNKIIAWLESTDFYTSPSSRYYHEAYPSGNLYHTLKVAMKTADLEYIPSFSSVRPEDACLVALVHDWCKIGLYEPTTKNVKNKETGQWEQVPSYSYYEKPMTYLGHGVSSMWLAMKHFNLSYEESLATRFHMGEYNIAPNEMNELHNANTYHPIVQLIQFADRLAVVNY